MPINWDKFHDDLDDAVEAAGSRTDAALASKISSITRLTDDEVKRLFPDPADVKRLAELMQIVKQAGDRNEKVSQIVDKAEEFAGIMLTLLQRFA